MDNWELSFEPELLKANIFLKSKNFYFPPEKNVIVKPKEKVIIKLKKNVSVKRKRVILTLREQNISKIKRKRKVRGEWCPQFLPSTGGCGSVRT